jgi:hypothetical protein
MAGSGSLFEPPPSFAASTSVALLAASTGDCPSSTLEQPASNTQPTPSHFFVMAAQLQTACQREHRSWRRPAAHDFRIKAAETARVDTGASRDRNAFGQTGLAVRTSSRPASPFRIRSDLALESWRNRFAPPLWQ